MDRKDFCQKLPKLELHAHLNGSLSKETLRKLYKLQRSDSKDYDDVVMSIEQYSSLDECFKVFDVAHSLTTNPKAIFLSTQDVIREFRDDNLIYLELRSTPRAVEGQMTKREYIEAMINAVKECERNVPDILVKLLVSVNRKQGYEEAQENIELAIEYGNKYPQYVIGIDLSGDPMFGDAFIELLEKARAAGLKVSAHCAEIPNETETLDILKFQPDRLGHCTCIHPTLGGSKELFNALLESKIPVELCLTSNMKCKTVPSYAAHHFKYLYEAGHPVCLATDDKGVFSTSLSKEYEIAGRTFDLNHQELEKLCLSSIEYTFATIEEKAKLLSKYNDIITKRVK